MAMQMRSLLAALALVGAAASSGGQPARAQGAPAMPPAAAAQPAPYATIPLGQVLGRDGYFEVTPAGSLVFYPVWNSIDPGVMHTILAMMGATSMISERGHYRVVDGSVQFFLPPGATPGLGGIQARPIGPGGPLPPGMSGSFLSGPDGAVTLYPGMGGMHGMGGQGWHPGAPGPRW